MRQEPPRLSLVTEDSFAALVRLYLSRSNPKFHAYAEATQNVWTRELNRMARADMLGSLSKQEIRPSLVQAYFDGIAGAPAKQSVALSALKQLEKWAIVRELLPRQITLGVEIGRSEGGHVPWTEEQIALGEQHARPDLARVIILAANTGQRGSDLVRMCPTDIETVSGLDGINVVQKKTGKKIWIPITSTLAAAMKTWDRVPGPFLRDPKGRPWTRAELSTAWGRERDTNPELKPLREAGLVLHGLRAAACVSLKRAGANAQQIADMIGMSVPMVARYCRFSVQRENATAAVLYLERTFGERNINMSNKAEK